MFHSRGPTFLELCRQALSSTEEGYDLLAPKFEYTPFRTPEPLLEAVAPHLGAPQSLARGLDLCCGTGAGLSLLQPLCRELVVGVDFSAGMLAEAARRLPEALDPEAPRVELLQADVCSLSYDRTFDMATCFGALGHIPEEQEDAFVAGVVRALRPGGRFVFVTGHRPPGWSTHGALVRGFDMAMRVRNALWSPPFIMYYQRFMLPEVEALLMRHDLSVRTIQLRYEGLPEEAGPWLVVATRRAAEDSEARSAS